MITPTRTSNRTVERSVWANKHHSLCARHMRQFTCDCGITVTYNTVTGQNVYYFSGKLLAYCHGCKGYQLTRRSEPVR